MGTSQTRFASQRWIVRQRERFGPDGVAGRRTLDARFDTPEPVPHPKGVRGFANRLSVVFLTLALVAGQAGVCPGWMATPEARMACCSEDGPCSMHKSDSADDESKRVVSQAEADRCCAASEQDDSAPSPTGPAFTITLAVALSPLPALLPQSESHVSISRASVPIPAAHVPKHVLLSVFLV